ncbi:glycosyltransferase family 2 protein [Adlercreutzia sp. R21]|uniref:Glycosyltransferase family 2 protein n=1 Tax=Adlercreutzia wanghongyangiae TaxID=3111451 RepID=A0ABU6IGY0_9ACTN|nr:glycosyltransferase family 2 protein [Adlercreutzia sp. R21]MEC4175707.1 glycosyltransferase family 2 protein [Adlercreutzia sp. R7]MEC4185361.1 glycosyltransferase family 2 protein [Adlercreutzia sp. R21]
MPAAPSSIKISIIVPCYKAADTLPRCLDALLGQTLPDIEIIAVNDGSPDKCIDILRAYQKEHEDQLVIIDKENEGAWAARRDGIAAARGRHIGFVDADDYVAPEFCETLYACAVQHDADITVCGFCREDASSGRVLSEELTHPRAPFNAQKEPARLLELNTAPWNKLFRADLLKEMGNLRQPPAIFEDVMMHLLVFPRTENVAFAGGSLVRYCVHEGSLMTSITAQQIDSTYQSLVETKDIIEAEDAPQKMMQLVAAEAFLHMGISLMFHVSCDKDVNLKVILRDNKAYLDEHFPSWKSSAIISFGHAVKYRGANLKVWLGRLVYRAHLMRAALGAYRFMIEKMGKDIKW